VHGCDFDTTGDLCGWTAPITEISDSIKFGFEQWIGQTEIPDTGKDDDFSKPGCEYQYSCVYLITLQGCTVMTKMIIVFILPGIMFAIIHYDLQIIY